MPLTHGLRAAHFGVWDIGAFLCVRDGSCAETVETPIPAPAGRAGAYSYSPRSDELTANDLRGVP